MIFINDIPSFRDPERCTLIFSDRVEKIETLGGIVVQDLGHIEDDDVFFIECMFTVENCARVSELWESRTKVRFTDTAGVVYNEMRIVIKELTRDKDFPKYIMMKFELWGK